MEVQKAKAAARWQVELQEESMAVGPVAQWEKGGHGCTRGAGGQRGCRANFVGMSWMEERPKLWPG